MNAYLSLFRFLMRFSLSEAIFLSTFPLSTLVSFFARSSNARHPLGFFAAMLIAPCLGKAHEPGVVDASQFAVGQTLADGAAHCSLKPASVVALAGVESESLLGRVALQVERGDRDVSSFERPLEQRPEVLQAVRVNRSANVFAGVVDRSVQVRQTKLAVAGGRVGEDLSPVANVAADGWQDGVGVVDRDHFAPNLRREFPECAAARRGRRSFPPDRGPE